ncbi:Uncharacterised protein [Mycobacteroides abscessus subsp. abscessus]|nr:Uncharacterised protein [Mycobacteroides abscessus subsp. abscessus]
MLGEQAYRRAGGHRLAGAGFAYQGDDLAPIDAQADVGDGRTRVVEGDSKGVDLQCGCGIDCCVVVVCSVGHLTASCCAKWIGKSGRNRGRVL